MELFSIINNLTIKIIGENTLQEGMDKNLQVLKKEETSFIYFHKELSAKQE